jgi:type I restriction enzyme M protein
MTGAVCCPKPSSKDRDMLNTSLITQYLNKQKNKVVESYDFKRNKIKYSEKIKSWKIDKIKGDEEIVRAFILAKLVNELGYKAENIELEKEYDIGRPKVNKPRIDIIVKDDKENAFLYIELKSPQDYEKDKDEVIEKQLFNLASQEKGQGKKVKYLVLYTIETTEEDIKDKCILIDYEKFAAFDAWKDVRDYADKLPERYGKAQKEPYVKDGEKDLETNFTHEQLDGLRKNLHNVLWGGGGTDDNDVFSSLVNIILAKIQDEGEKKKGQKYDFQIFAFKKSKENEEEESFESNEELFERINGLYKRALKQRLNILDEAKLKKSFVIDENKFSLNKLKYAVSELERFSFVDGKNSFTGKDILGDFFEGIIREGFKQTKGQFFTHINIVQFLLWGLQLDKLAIDRVNSDLEIPYLIDPTTGSGTFLIEYMKFITDNLKRRFRDKLHDTRDVEDKFQQWFLPDHRENKWAKDNIYGVEINFNLGTATKVNMILHGDGSTNIFVKDGLLPFRFYDKETAPNFLKQSETDKYYFDKEVNGQFDCIITNPPFSVDLDNETKKNVKKEFVFGDKKNSENLFIERWYQLLKANGRFGAVLPESVFDTTENKYIRLFIYKYFKVKAVVSLPQLTFEPFTSTKTSLLFAQKKTKAEIAEWNKVWSAFSTEWNNLKTRCENLLAVYLSGKNRKKLTSIKDLTPKEEKDIMTRMLKDYLEEDDKTLSAKEIIEKYAEEIKDLCKYDKDTKDTFGFVNTWWVFGEVAKKLNYQIFMAEVENVGYKRTKRGEKVMPNELFRVNAKGEVLVNDGVKKTALDKLREVQWD